MEFFICRRKNIPASISQKVFLNYFSKNFRNGEVLEPIGIERREEIKKPDNLEPLLEPSTQSGLTSNQDEPDPPLDNVLKGPKCFDD